jgi:tetratricopeptide (TPR) repeat protein
VDPSGRDDQVTAILNYYAFLLDQAGKHENAIAVLQIVIARDPNRAVAYLNLAVRGDNRGAARHYDRYAGLMKDADKADKIPARGRASRAVRAQDPRSHAGHVRLATLAFGRAAQAQRLELILPPSSSTAPTHLPGRT